MVIASAADTAKPTFTHSQSESSIDSLLQKVCFKKKTQQDGDDEDDVLVFQGIQDLNDLQIFLDRASRLLDEVENELVDEVSAKADSFFEAISALGSLSDQTASLSNASANLASVMSDVQSRHSQEINKLESIMREQEVLLKSQTILGKVLDFIKSQATIQVMLDTHAFSDALRLVSEKITLLRTELSEISVFGPVLIELEEMKMALEKMLQANVIS